MKTLQSVVASIKSKVFKMSGDKINQTERNAFKSEVLASLLADLGSVGSVSRTADGIVLEVENDELGVIHLEFDVKVKDTSFDLAEAVADYETMVNARTERVTSAAKRKEQRIAEKAAKSKKQFFTERNLTEYGSPKTTHMRGSEWFLSRQMSGN